MTAYRALYLPDHPSATKNGYVLAHVVIAERALGRRLASHNKVHHVDGDPSHNANRNLVICQDQAYHLLLHARARVLKAGGNPNTDKICYRCQQVRDKKSFPFNKSRWDGLDPMCRKCRSICDGTP